MAAEVDVTRFLCRRQTLSSTTYPDAPFTHSYSHLTHTLSEILAPGYFDALRGAIPAKLVAMDDIEIVTYEGNERDGRYLARILEITDHVYVFRVF